MQRIIAADIGGTSSRFALFENSLQGLELKAQHWFDSDQVNSFPELIESLIDSEIAVSAKEVDAVCIAAAGPVLNGSYCAPPNNDWDIDLAKVANLLPEGRATLINDFVALAYACTSPIAKTAEVIAVGQEDDSGAIAVLGAGTGLGKAFLLQSPQGLLAGSSEGGHVAFPAENQEELECAQFIAAKEKSPYATWDMVVSGRGLAAIHQFLSGEKLEPEDVSAELDRSPKTCEMFSRFYGRVCRDFALELVTTGGLYIAGGVASKNKQLVQSEAFLDSFYSSTVHEQLLRKISLRLLSAQDSGLWGAAIAGKQLNNR